MSSRKRYSTVIIQKGILDKKEDEVEEKEFFEDNGKGEFFEDSENGTE